MKLHHREFGQGPPLVILHGLLGSLDNWVPLAQRLAADFRVFLVDLRNHGRSPHADEFNYEVMGSDVALFLRDHKLNAARLLGHSMGAKVAMRLAQLHPHAVQQLIVADMSPREYPRRHDTLLDAMHALDLRKYERRDEVDRELAAAVPDRAVRQLVLKNLGRDEQGRLSWKANVAAIRSNYDQVRRELPVSAGFDGKTLFVRGGRSDYMRDEDLPLIRRLFPKVTFETIALAGHWVHADAPDEFCRVVTDFLLGSKLS